MEEGLPAVILNPGIIFGAGTYGKSSSSLFSEVNKGLKFYTNGGGSFVDVRDVSKIAIDAVNRNISNERFVLVSESRSLRSVFNLLAKYLGKKEPSILANRFILNLGWRIFYLKDLLSGSKSSLTKESAKAANSSFSYNSEKAKKMFDMDFNSCEKSIQFFSKYYQQV
jgi:dihydroflavonol-4-reductase